MQDGLLPLVGDVGHVAALGVDGVVDSLGPAIGQHHKVRPGSEVPIPPFPVAKEISIIGIFYLVLILITCILKDK